MSVELHGAVEPLAEAWDDLADRAGALPWLRPGWFAAYARAFARGELEIFVVRRDGRMAAVAPFERRLGELRALSNWHTPSFSILGEDSSARAELGRALAAHGPRRIVLMFCPPEDPTLNDVATIARANRHRTIVRTLERSPFVRVEGDWETYLRSRGPKLAQDIRRRRRRLEEHGEVTIEVAETAERLDEGVAVEAAGWKGQTGTAIATDPPARRFYEEIARWGAERGWLRFAFLRLDGRALAFDFALEDHGYHALLKTGYDEAWQKQSPGKLLREAMIRRAFENGFHTYDFLGDEMPWKMEWTDTIRELKLLQAFSPRPDGVADWAAWAYGRPLAKRVLALRHR